MRNAVIVKTDEIRWFIHQELGFPSEKDMVFLTSLSELDQYDDIDKLFFAHWSKKVPKNIIDKYECICFHPTPLPYGRGGTPYQNMILAGHKQTTMTAFRMTDEIDAGPIYLTAIMSLQGNLEKIRARGYAIIANMIKAILLYNPKPYPQEGTVLPFDRRKPEDSNLLAYAEKTPYPDFYDFIRMLDDDTYPRAFIRINDNTVILLGDVRQENGDIYGSFRLCNQ